MSFSRSQTANNSSSGPVGALSTAFSSSVTVGDLIVVTLCHSWTGVLTGTGTVTDSGGNTYDLELGQVIGGSGRSGLQIWSAIATTGGVLTVTYTPTNTGVIEMCIVEYTASGSISVDGFSANSNTSGTTLSSGSFTTTQPDVIVSVGLAGFTSQTWTPGSGFSSLFSVAGSGSALAFLSQDELNVSAGSQNPSMTDTTGSLWASGAVAFSAVSDTLSASAGSFSLTGESASLLESHKLSASSGSFALTGEPANLLYNIGTIAASRGAFSLTGDSGALFHDRILPASTGSFTLTGEPASILYPFIDVGLPGSFALTGESAGLVQAPVITASAGSFSLTGESAALATSAFSTLVASVGSFAVGRIPANLLDDRLLSASVGSFSLTGEPASISFPFTNIAAVGLFAITGESGDIGQGYNLESASIGTFVLNGQPAGLEYGGPIGDVNYHVYSNTGIGDPINYSVAIDATAGLTYTTTPLSFPGTWSFGVRAFWTGSGLEEQNVDSVVTIVLDASGNDITNSPPAPTGLRAFSLANGTAKAEWYEPPSSVVKQPTQFNVYMGTPTPNYSSPAAVVDFSSSIFNNTFFVVLNGLANGTTYQIGVRAQNATAEEKNTNVVSVTGATVGPTAVENLTAVATS